MSTRSSPGCSAQADRAGLRPIRQFIRRGANLLLFAALLPAAALADAPTPPGPPSDGPGSLVYSHAGVKAAEVRTGAKGWWLFTPTGREPASAPIVVFCHGWGALDPAIYRAWIDHIVRRGAILIYPLYQDNLSTPTADFLPNTEASVAEALAYLKSGRSGIAPEPNHLAILGHSAGGIVAANLAAEAADVGLPSFAAVMSVEPGNSWEPPRIAVPLGDLGRMPRGTLLLILVGADDRVARERDGWTIYEKTTQVPPADKNLLEMESDSHGEPTLLANHLAPTAVGGTAGSLPGGSLHGGRVDALDWYATWKLFDALTGAAFYDRERDMALGGTPAQLDMGRWGDGQPVKPLRLLK